VILERAAEILNREKHLGFDRWKAEAEELRSMAPGVPDATFRHVREFTEFEAIAIAEKYERGDKPAPSRPLS
jgi:hypothetical protein